MSKRREPEHITPGLPTFGKSLEWDIARERSDQARGGDGVEGGPIIRSQTLSHPGQAGLGAGRDVQRWQAMASTLACRTCLAQKPCFIVKWRRHSHTQDKPIAIHYLVFARQTETNLHWWFSFAHVWLKKCWNFRQGYWISDIIDFFFFSFYFRGSAWEFLWSGESLRIGWIAWDSRRLRESWQPCNTEFP